MAAGRVKLLSRWMVQTRCGPRIRWVSLQLWTVPHGLSLAIRSTGTSFCYVINIWLSQSLTSIFARCGLLTLFNSRGWKRMKRDMKFCSARRKREGERQRETERGVWLNRCIRASRHCCHSFSVFTIYLVDLAWCVCLERAHRSLHPLINRTSFTFSKYLTSADSNVLHTRVLRLKNK